MSPTEPAVELHGITKRFPGVVANHDIDIEVAQGTVHAIVGENGAGKSTLMKILYGMQRPDEGTIKVAGEEVSLHSPADAIARGIGMVHQHFMLADNLSVLENVVLGAEKLHGIGGRARRGCGAGGGGRDAGWGSPPASTGSVSSPAGWWNSSASVPGSASRSSR